MKFAVTLNRTATTQAKPARIHYRSEALAAHSYKTTLVTNDPEAVREFRSRHGRVVFKSISGIRSIVREVDAMKLGIDGSAFALAWRAGYQPAMARVRSSVLTVSLI